MPKHRHFEELCAVATLGDLPAPLAVEFESHLSGCDECRQRCTEYRQLREQLLGIEHREGEAAIESSRDRVWAAMWANIDRADNVVRSGRNILSFQPADAALRNRRFIQSLWIGAGAIVAAALVFGLGIQYDRSFGLHNTLPASAKAKTVTPPHVSVTQLTADHSDKLKAENSDLAAALNLERQERQDIERKLALDDQELTQAMSVQASLQAQVDSDAAMVKASQAELNAKTAALTFAQSANSSDGATIAVLQNQVHDLTARVSTESASLERERDMLSYGRQIRDIIGARNLHVVDVFDVNPEGAVKKSFARAFYTEGKSLVYYAFDLPERKLDSDKYSYVAWGESSRTGATPRKIGILYQDDRTQKRWSLIYENPQVLKEIDSVFVTLEPNDKDVEKPKGVRLLTAYLGAPPNHP